MEAKSFRLRTLDALDELGLEDTPWAADGVAGQELARAVLNALAKRLGPDFVDEVAEALANRRIALAKNFDSVGVEKAQMLDTSDIWLAFEEATKLTDASPDPTTARETG